MSRGFADATAVEVISRTDAEIALRGVVQPGWDIGGNANGGYLLAIAGRAMAEVVGRRPLTITAHYLRPAPAGPCGITVDVVRAGRRLATVSATLSQEDRPVVQLLGTFGDQQPGGPRRFSGTPFDIAPFDECVTRPPTNELPGLVDRLAQRLHPADADYQSGEPSGEPIVRGWFALADDEPIDAFGLLLASDAFPPPIFNTGLPVAWVPTVELTVHVRGEPVPGPLRCRFRSEFIGDGLLNEDGEIWDDSGALVAQSRQIALMPRA